jgi:hypothetical protein
MTLEVKRGPSCGNGGYGNCGIEPEGTNAHREAAAHVLMSPGQAMAAALIPAHTLAKSDQRSRPIPSAGRTQTLEEGLESKLSAPPSPSYYLPSTGLTAPGRSGGYVGAPRRSRQRCGSRLRVLRNRDMKSELAAGPP